MVTVSITRYALESDPLEVIAGARPLANAKLADWGLRAEYQSQGDFVDLRVTGWADQKTRNFLDALKGFGVTRCAVNVDAAEEETELGESVDGFDVCFS